ncbi:MAG: polysaccharide deacetylase family protein [Candidatus Marinimicrobia bacterium]|nr:polysaccharide deacetylase family protein [Candidatus Neomarinimicrobiota bacterium]
MLYKKIVGKIWGQNGIKILAYHKVNNEPHDYLGLNTTISNFKAQMKYLKRNYNIISLKDAINMLHSTERIPMDTIVITFDDGYKDNYLHAFPILKKYKIPATIFVTTNPIESRTPLWFERISNTIEKTSKEEIDLKCFELGRYAVKTESQKREATLEIVKQVKEFKPEERSCLVNFICDELEDKNKDNSIKLKNNNILSWEEIREMKEWGITIGSHALSHIILSKVPIDYARHEIFQSKKVLEEKLGEEISLFAYPNGSADDFNEKIIDLVREAGYICACALIKGINRKNDCVFALKRIEIDDEITRRIPLYFSMPVFAAEVAGLFDLLFLRFLRR